MATAKVKEIAGEPDEILENDHTYWIYTYSDSPQKVRLNIVGDEVFPPIEYLEQPLLDR